MIFIAVDQQYVTLVKICRSDVRNMDVCHVDGKCSSCDFAKKFENPEN